MGLAALEALLKASMGLSAASIGSAAIARAVRERRLVCNLVDPEAYLALVGGSGVELQALIEAVVVAETWFFRDRHAFTTLARIVREEWLPSHPEGELSMLSLPCSTGEEPYSMAMALLDAGVATNRFRVDAVDISFANLGQGVRGVYGRNSFRGGDLGFRDRHFDATSEGHSVKDDVRQSVHFQQGNLFAAGFLPGTAIYDVIFCRNVLIYFDRPTQDRALAVLNRLLRAAGVLFVAPAETALAAAHDLVSTNEPLAFAFRKAAPGSSGLKRKVVEPAPPVPRRAVAPIVVPLTRPTLNRGERREFGGQESFPNVFPATAAGSRGSLSAAAAPARSLDPAVDLDEATRLADQGHFVEAAACCEEHLRRSGPSATAFYLLGLVRDATGDHAQAAAFYRKALYLDPNHYDTQIHLALLMENQGDSAGAQVMRNRARRLEAKSRQRQ